MSTGLAAKLGEKQTPSEQWNFIMKYVREC